MSDQEVVRRHRAIWLARPELRAVYQEWFAQLGVVGRGPTSAHLD